MRLRSGDVLGVGTVGLRTRPGRTILTALGIAIGIAAMVAVVAISSSSRADVLDDLDRLGTNLLEVGPGQSFLGDQSELPEPAPSMIRRIGPVEDAAALGSVGVTVRRTDQVPASETGGIAVYATEPELVETLKGTVADGVFLNDATAQYPAVVLGAKAAERLGISSAAGHPRIYLGDRWFTVVGILAPFELTPGLDRAVFIGFPVAIDLFDHSGSASTVYVRTDPDAVEAVRDVLPGTANPEHPNEVQVTRPSDALEARATVDDAHTQQLLGLGVVALVVGGVGIANVMVISVLERRSEIGVRRALGASRGHVRSQFVVEAVLLSALGGIAGVLLGGLVTYGYAHRRSWTVDIPLSAVGGGVAAALVVGALAGLYPAVRAARLSPVEAIRPG